MYVEEATAILENRAADERSSVWKPAAAVEIAQRRPVFDFPILARWRTERPRMRCALRVLEALAKP